MDETYMLVDNQQAKQFQFELEQGVIARIEYIKTQDGRIYLTHTEVPQAYGGKGIGSKLIGQTLELIKAQGWSLIPLCPFGVKYLHRHPEWKALVPEEINIG